MSSTFLPIFDLPSKKETILPEEVCTGPELTSCIGPLNYQASSKVKTTGGGGGAGEQIVKQNYPPPPHPHHSKNRPIREFKMQKERRKSSRFSNQNKNFAPTSHFLVHLFRVSLTRTTPGGGGVGGT